jgi:Flp pilus assembly protein TadG
MRFPFTDRRTPAASSLRALARTLCATEEGAVAPIIGVMLLVLIGSMGFAIDAGRGFLAKARLTDALDSAGLAIGARLGTTDYNGDARKFVDANFKAAYAGATVTNVTATPNAGETVIKLTATAVVPTSVMGLFGAKGLTVSAYSEVVRSSSGLELVLAMDNTGSMAADMTALKSAAKSLVALVYGPNGVADKVYVGLVPFSQAVAVDPSAQKAWFDADHAKTQVPQVYWSYWPALSTGCAEARSGGLDQTDDPPVQTKKETLLHYYFNPYAPGEDLNAFVSKKKFAEGCPQPMLPMTPSKTKVDAAIDAMAASGNTHVNLGAVWAWRMLSPKWRGFWAGDMASRSLPLDYNAKTMTKVAVIMTDGENTMDGIHYTAYGRLAEGRLGAFSQSAAVSSLNARLTTSCNRMKAAGVVVYTVAFRNPGATIKTLLQNCASKVEYYFDPTTGADLKTAFKTIGGSLSALRISR